MLQMMNKALRTVCLAGLAAWMSASYAQNARFDVFEYRIEGDDLIACHSG